LLSIDPTYAPALYILGKWHLTLSTLSSLEKIGCSLLFNDVAKHASLNNALACFDKAISLEPEYILFHYNRALAQYYSGNMDESRRSINRALTLAHKEADDVVRVNKCRDLLNKINNEE
jgi:tetratricopeptide (TPR) repeat protein